ncbi:MAG TPA: YusW family protein [Sporosarcina psychrophila]|uniref:YusW family protein n=1 Tax=Sporosarcina psychrophila TaxID=1476 RepID=A0A921FWJ3_SPOPS|nr:YusW family protein [Sporosarcina psychrophila]
MKSLNVLGVALISGALLLGACGNLGKNADKPNREEADVTLEREKEGGSIETGDGFGFNTFDLEIDVDGKDAIDVDYNVEKKAEAEYENKLMNIKVKDNEAMDELNLLFLDIRITKDTPEKEVIDKILQWYGLDSYSKFDLEVEFDDGTTLDIENVK